MDDISEGFPPNGVPERSPQCFSGLMFGWLLQIS
jgi:hypothetical protein